MTLQVTVTTRTSAARRALFILRTEIDALAATLPERAAEMAVTRASATTDWKDKSGKTRGTIRARPVGPYRWRFVARGASVFLNDGTGLYGKRGSKYPIVPKTEGGFLRFQVRGQWVTAKRVMHPGIKATHFVDKARDDAEVFMMSDLALQLNSVIAAHNRR
jgi:hypothetical protein